MTISGDQSTSILENANVKCSANSFPKMQEKSLISKDNMMEREKNELSFCTEEYDDMSLIQNTTMSTVSMDDSSYSSMIMSADIQPTMKGEKTDVDGHLEYGRRESSVSELASERLYLEAAERQKRDLILPEILYQMKTHKGTASNAIDYFEMILNKSLNKKTSADSNRHEKTNEKDPVEESQVSDFVVDRLISQGIERKNRLALLREEYNKCQPKITQKDYYNKLSSKKESFSRKGKSPFKQSVGDRLISQGIEREKRLALLRDEYNQNQEQGKFDHQADSRKIYTEGELELVCNRLISQGIEREKRLALLREEYTQHQEQGKLDQIADSRKIYSEEELELVCDRLISQGIKREKRLALLREKFNHHHGKFGLQINSRRNSSEGDLEIVCDRLISQGKERETRLELLRKQYQDEQANSTLTSENEKKTDPSKVIRFEQLYALSKSTQEDGKKRRVAIKEAIAKANAEWIPPTGKISIVEASRLYYDGMRQIVALERRRIEAAKFNL